jgi:hypothetical protein
MTQGVSQMATRAAAARTAWLPCQMSDQETDLSHGQRLCIHATSPGRGVVLQVINPLSSTAAAMFCHWDRGCFRLPTCHRVYREVTQDRHITMTPPDQVRYFMAKGSPSTPAPTMAVVLWNALQAPTQQHEGVNTA